MPQRALNSIDHLLVVPGPKDIWLASTRAMALSALGLAWWNSLSLGIRALWDLIAFCRASKMEPFHQAFK